MSVDPDTPDAMDGVKTVVFPGLQAGPSEDQHFFAPWQAKAFALVVHLNETGLFTWAEWVEFCAKRIKTAPPLAHQASPQDHADDYYRAWLAALSDLLEVKGIAGSETVRDMARTWQRAAHATPHGTPIIYEAGQVTPP